MMEVVFLGVGEAFDEELSNTSILIRCETEVSRVTFLMDCGFTAPPLFWKEVPQVDALDGIWISHFHGDHSLGLPALLVRFREENRSKSLTISGQKGIEAFTRASLDLAYPGFYKKIGFPIRYFEVEPDHRVEILGLSFQTAVNGHSQRDLALRMNSRGKSLFYSGDGKPTPDSRALARGSDLIIHEAFHMEQEIPGHGTVKGSIDMAKECGASNLALVHIQRISRKQVLREMEKVSDWAGLLPVLVPDPGYRMTF